MQQLSFLFLISLIFVFPTKSVENPGNETDTSKMQLALLLDTSNSMDGLIGQAKSQLWKIVNFLATSTHEGNPPQIEIAVYAYGNDDFNGKKGYVKQILPLTSDLDVVSDALFQLRTKGGSEYCGEAIYQSLQQLPWTAGKDGFKMIVIAGNEPFTQGPTNPSKAYTLACDKGVAVTAIFCGNWQEGIDTGWKDAPACVDSDYFNIDQDQAVAHIPTPYDDEIVALNKALNDTYLAYGVEGEKRMEMQSLQDKNANSFGTANLRERISFKSKSQYKNTSWDLVDAYEDDALILESVEDESLPPALQGKSTEDKIAFITQKQEERSRIKKEIKVLEEKASGYIAKKQAETSEEITLDQVMITSIKELATKKGFDFK